MDKKQDKQYISEDVLKLSEKNPRLVNIALTGGFDSSFTMVYISRYDISIQPYYVSDKRKSENNEINAIIEITADIMKHPDTKCKILPLKIIKSSEIEPDDEITTAYNRLYDATKIGSQYDWLARFAKSVDGLMLNLEKSDNSKILNCIKQYGYLRRIKEGDISYCVVDKNKSSEDLVLILKSLYLPLPLLEMTKLETYEYYKKLGYGESAKKTWFCFSPIDGKPCGKCNPCRTAIGDGMTFRFTEEALRRYAKSRRYRWFKALAEKMLVKFGLLKKVRNIMRNLRI